jgi:hypothetical protein
VYSTVVGNSADVSANVLIHQASFMFRSAFGSVVAEPLAGGENCGFQGTIDVTSNGGNFSDDSSCEFTNTARCRPRSWTWRRRRSPPHRASRADRRVERHRGDRSATGTLAAAPE